MVSNKQKSIYGLGIFLAILLALNYLAGELYWRFDLTKEKRYSIAESTVETLKGLDDVVYIKVYLHGEFPAGFERLESATRDLLNEFKVYAGRRIEVQYIDPTAERNEQLRSKIQQDLESRGLRPTRLTVKDVDQSTQKKIYPGALISFGDREMPVQLLENQIGYGQEMVLNNSIILLEYKFANAIRKLSRYGNQRIVFLQGHGELAPPQWSDFAVKLKELMYEVDTLDLRSEYKIPEKADLCILAKPRVPFSEKEKFKLDQFVMRGGKLLWLLDHVNAEMDSMRGRDFHFAQARDLNLTDQLLTYGVRVNEDLLMDLQLCLPIPVVIGESGGVPQQDLFPWFYFPLLGGSGDHPIIRNLDPVSAQFANSIDTLPRNDIRKTVLLHTSRYSKAVKAPVRIHFGIIKDKPPVDAFQQSYLPGAVLLEGEFESVFRNRLAGSFRNAIDSSSELSFSEKSVPTRMIVIGDGDLIRNDVGRDGSPFPLGYYRYTQQTFANKEFLLNCVEYLLDETGSMQTRSKEIRIRALDKVRLQEEKVRWQLFNLLLPLVFITVFGLLFVQLRKRRYHRK